MNKEIKREIEKQMDDAGLRFNAQSLEDAYDAIDDSADYIEEVYADEPTAAEMVAAWIEDKQRDSPEMFVSIADTPVETFERVPAPGFYQ